MVRWKSIPYGLIHVPKVSNRSTNITISALSAPQGSESLPLFRRQG
jgi:hypothetical protein